MLIIPIIKIGSREKTNRILLGKRLTIHVDPLTYMKVYTYVYRESINRRFIRKKSNEHTALLKLTTIDSILNVRA